MLELAKREPEPEPEPEPEQEQQQPPFIATWAEFEGAFRGMLLSAQAGVAPPLRGRAHFDSPACSLRCAGDPIVVTVGARVQAQVESGLAFTVWEFNAAGPTYNDVLAGIAEELKKLLQVALNAAAERHRTRIVAPPDLSGGNGEQRIAQHIMQGRRP